MDPLYAYSGMIIYYTMKRCVLVCSFHIVRRIQIIRITPRTIHIQVMVLPPPRQNKYDVFFRLLHLL